MSAFLFPLFCGLEGGDMSEKFSRGQGAAEGPASAERGPLGRGTGLAGSVSGCATFLSNDSGLHF